MSVMMLFHRHKDQPSLGEPIRSDCERHRQASERQHVDGKEHDFQSTGIRWRHVVADLSGCDYRSKLKTWAYRVAVNYILDVKKSPVERLHLSFERFAEDLSSGLGPEAPEETERSLLIEEVKVGCTLGMLQCLDRPHRLTYILGEILDLPGPQAAEALGISPDLFRKRLQHARISILTFTRTYCGLASDTAACSETASRIRLPVC